MTAAVIALFLVLVVGIPAALARRNTRYMTTGLNQPNRCDAGPVRQAVTK